MLADYHVHLDRLDWSLNSIDELCKNAREQGISRVGIVVHTKILNGFQPLYYHILCRGGKHKKLVFNRNINEYISTVMYAKSLGYPVDLGLEVCYSPEGEGFLRNKLPQYPFDFTIGSVHLIGDKHFKTVTKYYKSKTRVGRIYYSLVHRAIESGSFNIIGHIEIVRREGIPGLSYYPDLLDVICESLVRRNCAVEVNTKWLRKHDYLVPDKSTLMLMSSRGVRVVFGSDAHHPDKIGSGAKEACEQIVHSGFSGFSII
jgi:histidinol-phosphatase (PHP family)